MLGYFERQNTAAEATLLSTSSSVLVRQPGYSIVAEARLDNRQALAARLAVSAESDAGLILAAYRCWRQDSPQYLRGDFAFALWDAAQRSLFCARDHFGSKPFYYSLSDSRFAFSTEIKQVLSVPGIPKDIHEPRIADFLVHALEGVDHEQTCFAKILRLPPARQLTIGPTHVQQRRYWALQPSQNIAGAGQSVDQFRDLFQRSVTARLVSESRPAAMLSGGLDSSSIVATARRQLQSPLLTLSAITPEQGWASDAWHAQQVIQQGGVQASYVSSMELSAYVPALDRLYGQSYDLFDSLIAHVPLTIYACAQQQGVSIVLDGLDGDMVCSLTSNYIAYLFRRGLWARGTLEAFYYSQRYYDSVIHPLRLLTQASRVLLPDAWQRAYRARRPVSWRYLLKDSLIHPEFAAAMQLPQRLQQLRSHFASARRNTLQEDHIARFNHPYAVVSLERYERVARMFGVEPRHPFLDVDLAEFCVALPWSCKVHQGWSKYILRQALQHDLPAPVVWRRGWDHVGSEFMHKWYALKQQEIVQIVGDFMPRLALYMDRMKLEQTLSRFRSGIAKETGDVLWQAMSLARFLQRHAS